MIFWNKSQENGVKRTNINILFDCYLEIPFCPISLFGSNFLSTGVCINTVLALESVQTMYYT